MNTKQQLNEARGFAQHYKDMCEEKNTKIESLREQLAKANERVEELEEIERKQSSMLEFYVNTFQL